MAQEQAVDVLANLGMISSNEYEDKFAVVVRTVYMWKSDTIRQDINIELVFDYCSRDLPLNNGTLFLSGVI